MQLTLTRCPHQILQVNRVRHSAIALFQGVNVETNKDRDTVLPGQNQPAEGPRVEATSNHPSMSESTSSIGTETQPQHESKRPFDQRNVSALPPLFDEIKILQERLLHLEDQAIQQWKATVEDVPPEKGGSRRKSNNHSSEDEEVLRKHIRKAPSGRRLVAQIERHAEEEAHERKDYGQGPHWADDTSTMYHVQKSGDMLGGSEYDAAYGPQGWVDTHGYPYPRFAYHEDLSLRYDIRPLPQRGVRPLTDLHPFYERPVRKGFKVRYDAPPLKLSRKLGPPTRWDESDPEEWSSDTSTRSQDFKYFRSRLRGDFEWELDRLNAQVLRYRKHKNKKKSEQLATKARRDNEKRDDELGEYTQKGEIIENLELEAKAAMKDEHGIRQLNSVGWSIFRLRRALPLQYSFVIDILVEEPKLSSDVELRGRVKTGKKDKKIHKTDANLRMTVANDTKSKDNAAQSFRQSTSWTEQNPLPERIRINSKQIMKALSSIHGSSLCPDEDESSSIVLLRPFRILDAYDKDIRRVCSTSGEGSILADSETSVPVREHAKHRPKSEIATDEEPVRQLPEASERTPAAEENESSISEEPQTVLIEHLNCLREFMDKYIARRLAFLNSVSCSKIFFSDVWHLFQPGETVISAGGKQAYRVVSLKSKRHKGSDRWAAFWNRQNERRSASPDSSDQLGDDIRADITIKCVSIHFDGKVFGPVLQMFHINKWDGEKEVTYLDVYPIRFYVSKELHKLSLTSTAKTVASVTEQDLADGMKVLRQRLIDRGRVFLDVAAVKQMYYSGLAVDTRDEIESQVMVDFEEALAHEKRRDWTPAITRLVGTDWNSKTDDANEGCTAECCWQENVHDDAYVETNNTEKFIDDMMAEIKDAPHKLPSAIIFPRTLQETKTDSNALTDEELMVMSYNVFGFVLRDRTWGENHSFLFMKNHLMASVSELTCNT